MSRTAKNLVTFAGVMALVVGGAVGGCSDGPTKPGGDAAGGTGAGGSGGGGSGGKGGSGGAGGATGGTGSATGGTGGTGSATGGTSGATGGAGGTLGPVQLDASGSGGSGGGGGSGQPDARATDSPTGVIPPFPPVIPPGLDAGNGEVPRDRLCTAADMAKPDGACPHKMVVACRPTEPGAPEWCICFPPPLDGKWHCGKEPPPASIAGR
jgi:hypothetical protein